jgi:hypothetical protein
MPASKAALPDQKELLAAYEFVVLPLLPESWRLLSTPPKNAPSSACSHVRQAHHFPH